MLQAMRNGRDTILNNPRLLSVSGHAHTSRRSPQKLSQTFRGSQGFVAKAEGSGVERLSGP